MYLSRSKNGKEIEARAWKLPKIGHSDKTI
jgi:hypothetical protein